MKRTENGQSLQEIGWEWICSSEAVTMLLDLSIHTQEHQTPPTSYGLKTTILEESLEANLILHLARAYEEKWVPPNVAVVNGRLYYSLPLSNWGEEGPLVCVDLRTGEEYWRQEIYMDTAQLYNFNSMNQHGIIPYLWDLGGSTCYMYDAETGELVLNLVNATGGYGIKHTFDKSGNIISYIFSGGAKTLTMWNSSKAVNPTESASYRPPIGGELDWRNGIEWEASLIDKSGQGLVLVSADVLVATKGYTDVWQPQLEGIGYDAHTGAYMWSFNLTDQMIQRTAYDFAPIMDGVLCWFDQAAMQWYGFDVQTGAQKWGPTDPYESAWGIYSQSYRGAGNLWAQVGYGKLYATAYDGTVHCYDLQTGKNEWNFQCESSGFETPYGTWPFYGGVTIADGKLYISNNEHSPNSPNWRGGKLYCLNAETGDELWSVAGWMPGPVIADGYMAVLNSYDGQIYCFGKGLTETKVTGPEAVQPLGTPVLIKGTVTDQSPGDTCLGIPAAGTPAVADEYMSEWKEYLYMQKPCPEYYEGVEVKLEVLDPNGNFYEIGTVKSDGSGMFKKMWTPETEGEYTVIATFEGSESYWRS
jgi:outer membrane protein assembly factor BamB